METKDLMKLIIYFKDSAYLVLTDEFNDDFAFEDAIELINIELQNYEYIETESFYYDNHLAKRAIWHIAPEGGY